MKRTIRVGLAAACALALLAISAPAANAETSVSRFPISFSFFNPCTNENVDFSGTGLAVIDTSTDNHFLVHFVEINVTGIGETSGRRYRELFTNTQVLNGDDEGGPFAETQSVRWRIVTAGPGNDFAFDIVFHMTINANGELVVQLNRLNEGSCA